MPNLQTLSCRQPRDKSANCNPEVAEYPDPRSEQEFLVILKAFCLLLPLDNPLPDDNLFCMPTVDIDGILSLQLRSARRWRWMASSEEHFA